MLKRKHPHPLSELLNASAAAPSAKRPVPPFANTFRDADPPSGDPSPQHLTTTGYEPSVMEYSSRPPPNLPVNPAEGTLPNPRGDRSSGSPPGAAEVPMRDTSIPPPPRRYGSSLGDLVAAATLAEPVQTLPSQQVSVGNPNQPGPVHVAPLTTTREIGGPNPLVSASLSVAEPSATIATVSKPITSPNDAKGPSVNAKEVVDQFIYLLEKGNQLFAGLREFTSLGTRPWQDYFSKTFTIYSKIWRFHKQYKVVLESPNHYGLKRWQIGEIASKIGQLYHHYYLRTSDTNNLLLSYTFYYTIRDRQYFRDLGGTKNAPLVVKRIRFYARFILACVMLRDDELAWKLLEELQVIVDNYSRTFRPVDAKEWQLVMQGIPTFLEAERRVLPRSITGSFLSLPHRVPEISALPTGTGTLRLQEAVLVGGYPSQFKFSDLTVDVYRMVQTLEYEPSMSKASSAICHRLKTTLSNPPNNTGDITHEPSLFPSQSVMSTDSQAGDVFSDHFASQETKFHQQPSDSETPRRVNPHKQMLFRPTYSYLMQNIAQAFRDTSDQSVLLLYLSAPGVKILKNEEALKHGFTGGIATRGAKAHTGEKPNEFTELSQVSNCLHPADLLPFTRKPVFLVVESNNSVSFQGIPRVFNQPFLCLMSPTSYVQANTSQFGNLFTLFLHIPILGLLSVTGVNQMDAEQWEAAKKHTEALLSILTDELANALQDSDNRKFLGDVFLRRLMIHHQFCHTVLFYHHLHSDDPAYLPTSYPEFPNSLLTLEPVCEKLRALVRTLKSENQFSRLFASDTVHSQTAKADQTTQQMESTTSNISSPDRVETMDVDSRQ